MNNSAVEEIKEKLSIEDVVSSYIKLEKTGINMRACCPFHNEKTPSFFVSPDRGSFYCFGCSKGGDIFTFVQEIEGVDFKGSLQVLADKAGVDITKLNFDKKEKIDDSLYIILEKATTFFQQGLPKNKSAQEYLEGRGLTQNYISKFRIGYVEDEWQSLHDYLKKEGYSDDKILATGLVIKNETGRTYDRFRGRIIFPIFDDMGKVVAYSARILTDAKDQPKYINSPETVLFNKSKILYGFNFAKQTIRKHDFAILVEGQLDVLMTHQIGYTNTIASSGTAFTEHQLKIIKRHTNNLLISFDGDSAGIKSSKKVWELALQNDMDVKVLPLKEGQDPADIIFENPDDWKELVKKSRHIIEHLASNIQKSFSDTRKRQKEVQLEIYPYLKNIKSHTDRSYFIDKISGMFGIDKDAILADMNNAVDLHESGTRSQESGTKVEEKSNFVNPRDVLYGLYLSKEIKDKDGYLLEIKKYITDDLILKIEKRKDKILFELDLLLEQYRDLYGLVEDMFSKVKIQKLEIEKSEIKNTLIGFDGPVDEEKMLMRKLEDITRIVQSVKKTGCHDLKNMI